MSAPLLDDAHFSRTSDADWSPQDYQRIVAKLNGIGADLYSLGDDASALEVYKGAVKCTMNAPAPDQVSAVDPRWTALAQKVAANVQEAVGRKGRHCDAASWTAPEELHLYEPPESATDPGPERLLRPLRFLIGGGENRWQVVSTGADTTLMYNMALVYLKNKSHEVALNLFDVSLSLCEDAADAGDIQSVLVSASAQNNIGHIHYMAGEYEVAEECFIEAMQLASSVSLEEDTQDDSGTSAKHILQGIEGTVHGNLGRMCFIRGDYESALNLCHSMLEMQVKEHEESKEMKPKILAAMANMGILHHKSNSPDKAAYYYHSFLEEARKFGQDTEDGEDAQTYSQHVVAILCKAILIQCQQGDYSESIVNELKLSFERLQAKQSSQGFVHASLPPILSHIGSILVSGLHEYGHATMFFSEALRVLRSLPPGHCQDFDIALALTHKGHAHELSGNHEAAMGCYKEALTCGPTTSGENQQALYPVFALIHYKVGMIHHKNQSPDEALEAFRLAVKISRCHAWEMDQHRDKAIESKKELATMLYNTGIVQLDMGHVSDALRAFNESLDIRRAILGLSHIQVAESLYQIARIHHNMGMHDAALNLYFQTVQIERETLGPHHPNVAVTLCNAAQILQLQGKFDDALGLYRTVLDITKHTTSNESPPVARILSNMGHIQLLLGNTNEANRLFNEAGNIGLPDDCFSNITLLAGIGSAAPAA